MQCYKAKYCGSKLKVISFVLQKVLLQKPIYFPEARHSKVFAISVK